MCTGCRRAAVSDAAFQLLQLLDVRFFGDVGPPLPHDDDQGTDRGRGNLDALLSNNYCRSQIYLSTQLAHLHPELTMPMYSEITCRFQTARPEVRQLLLQYLLPWLDNIEFVDPNVPPPNPPSYYQYFPMNVITNTREGLGSAEATEMVLNNLFYITAKFSDFHPKEIEKLWSTLCSCWPNNLKVIIRYLMIVSGMAPTDLLPYAKRVTVYLARSRTERLLDEMMTELQTVETLNCLIERTETPPFYRLTSIRKASSHSDGDCGVGQQGNVEPDVNIIVGATLDIAEKGTIHTKRHSGEDPIKMNTPKNESRGVPQPPPMPGQDLEETISPIQERQETEESTLSPGVGMANVALMDRPHPRPLPMPEYGGYFAPLTEYLPDSTQPISGFHRCNVAIMLLCDVVIDGLFVDWSVHVPLMLHIAFLGMDHTRPIVHEHCRQLLLNLLVTVAAHMDHLTVARILLGSQTAGLGLGLCTTQLPVLEHNFTEPDAVFDKYLQGSPQSHTNQNESHGHAQLETEAIPTTEGDEDLNCPSLPIIVTAESTQNISNKPLLPRPGSDMHISDIIKSLIHFLANRPNNLPLWNYEDITAKVWTMRSCQQLNTLLQHVLRIFRESLPHSLISERWAQTALQLGLSCPSRHYAGRSLQVFRFIGVAMTGRMVSDMLSRLVETAAEQGEDMQGYVTELLLTLESAVDSLESNFRPLDYMRDIFKSTPNLNNKDTAVALGATSSGGCIGCAVNHTRSTSYSVSYCMRKNAPTTSTSSSEEVRTRIPTDPPNKTCNNLCRSRSAQSLKVLGDSASQDDKLTILATLFWLGVSLLESDYEHEFLLGVRLLNRVMRRLPLDRPDARDRVDRLHAQLRWPSFRGVHALLLKGCTHPATYEPVVGLLSELTPLLELSVIDPTQSIAFPMTVAALLPYMLLHYEDANELCVHAACLIAQVSSEKSKKLENLGTVMSLYSRRTFSKESFQWTKCVVKYLWDTYSHLSLQMLAFLVEVLEKGAQSLQLPVLSILHCMLHYIDLNASSAQPINVDLLRVVAKFIDGGTNFKEAMKILKLVVTRCSTLVVPPHWDTNTTLVDTEQQIKKELPGRTMDFTFDLSTTPVIGRKYLAKSSMTLNTTTGGGGTGPSSLTTASSSTLDKTSSNSSSTTIVAQDEETNIVGAVMNTPTASTVSACRGPNSDTSTTFILQLPQSPRRLASIVLFDTASISGWKRPWMSQGRVRECLVNLLTTCGQRVGLPKSPSVIFSQSSELVERESSIVSSLEEVSAGGVGGNHGGDASGASRCVAPAAPTDQFAVFKDFDFLEYESESIEGETSDNFNWGVRRMLLSEETENVKPITTKKLDFSALLEPAMQQKIMQLMISPENQSGRKNISGEDSSDDELCPESPTDENLPNASLNELETSGLPPRSLSLRPRTHSASSGSSGAGDLGELTPCAGSSSFCVHDAWKNSILMMLRDCPSHSPMTFVYRTHTVLREIINKTLTLCLDGTRYLTSAMCNLAPYVAVTTLLDQLNNEVIPLIWIGPNAVSNTVVWETIKCSSLEMNEHLDTYFDRKQNIVEALDGQHGPEIIGRSLYKLLFQLILLLETNGKMVSSIYNAAIEKNATDCSSLVSSIREALPNYYEWGSETPTASACPSPQPSTSTPLAQNEDVTIAELLNEFRWIAALKMVRERNAKKILEKGEFPEDDLTSLLHIYCSTLIANHPDMVAVTRPISELMENVSLMLKNLYKVSLVLKMNTLHNS